MARLTLYPVRATASVRATYSSMDVHGAHADMRTILRNSDESASTHARGVTLLGIKVHSIRTVKVALSEQGSSYYADPEVEVLAVVLHPGEEAKVRGHVPIGWVMERIWLEDSVERFCVRIDELHLLNTWDAARHKVSAYLDDNPEMRLSHMTDEKHFHNREQTVRSWLSKLGWQHQNISVFVDVRDPSDHDIVVHREAQHVTRGIPSYGHNRLDSHLYAIGVYDSRYPAIYVRVPQQRYVDFTVAEQIDEWRNETLNSRLGGFLGMDESYGKPALEKARHHLGVHRPVMSVKPVSGRKVIVEDAAPRFPAATGCKVGGLTWLVFAINPETGAYRPAGEPEHIGVKQLDYMLIHRDFDCWRFIFVCHYKLRPAVGQCVKGTMLMPYVVEDTECSHAPRTISPQRGMPPEITKAINETPYCASAISHGLARLKYARSQMQPFHSRGGKLDTFSYPRFGALARSTHTGTTLYGLDRKASGKLRWETEKLRPPHAITEMAKGLRENLIEWAEVDETPIASVLGESARRPRALVLDM